MSRIKKERGIVGESVEMNVCLSELLYGVERDGGEGCVGRIPAALSKTAANTNFFGMKSNAQCT